MNFVSDLMDLCTDPQSRMYFWTCIICIYVADVLAFDNNPFSNMTLLRINIEYTKDLISFIITVHKYIHIRQRIPSVADRSQVALNNQGMS